jgi:hypothetical protein
MDNFQAQEERSTSAFDTGEWRVEMYKGTKTAIGK